MLVCTLMMNRITPETSKYVYLRCGIRLTFVEGLGGKTAQSKLKHILVLVCDVILKDAFVYLSFLLAIRVTVHIHVTKLSLAFTSPRFMLDKVCDSPTFIYILPFSASRPSPHRYCLRIAFRLYLTYVNIS